MTLNENDCSRIVSVVHNLKKQLKHLSYSQQQVFSVPFSLQKAQSLLIDEVLAEKVEAFTSRFCRFQDTIGDKLLPLWLKALGETISANIDNLDKAEKLGVLESADRWFEIRQLHNRMVHEYVDDIQLLTWHYKPLMRVWTCW